LLKKERCGGLDEHVNMVNEEVYMRCPKHPEIWLYENMMETEGYCPECDTWYLLRPFPGSLRVGV
jgi:uncharacterized Zn-finger protein